MFFDTLSDTLSGGFLRTSADVMHEFIRGNVHPRPLTSGTSFTSLTKKLASPLQPASENAGPFHTRFLRLTLAACACAIAFAAAPLQGADRRTEDPNRIRERCRRNPVADGRGSHQDRTSTSRRRGRVVASDGSGPVRRAQVRLTKSQDITPKVALTDAEGRFEFRELPGPASRCRRRSPASWRIRYRADAAVRIGQANRTGGAPAPRQRRHRGSARRRRLRPHRRPIRRRVA